MDASVIHRLQHGATRINIFNVRLDDDGARALAEALRGNVTLTQLDLSHNRIGDEGAHALAEVLRHNVTLTWLNLGDNQIGDEGVRTLADALRYNSTLNGLVLWGNKFGDEGARALAEMLEDGNACTLHQDEMHHLYTRIGCYAANVLRRYIRIGNRSLKVLYITNSSLEIRERIYVALLSAPYRDRLKIALPPK